MSRLIFVLGETGTGKSASLENVDPESSFLINCVGKDLPFRKWSEKWNSKKGNYHQTSTWATGELRNPGIIDTMKIINAKKPHVKNIIIDDFQYVMSFEYLNQLDGDVWEVFRGIGGHVFQILNTARNLRNDLNIFILSHSETIITEGIQKTKIKTVGKMVDEKITPEGLATIVLYTKVQAVPHGDNNHYFLTQNDGTNTAKSPKGMFENSQIPNDLNAVIEAINNYY